MSAPPTIYVDDLIDQQKLNPRSIFVLGLLLVALLCDGFDLQVLAFAAPGFVRDWGIERSTLGPVFSANLFGMMCGAIGFGYVGDRFGRKRIIVIGTILYSVACLSCLLANDLWQLGALRFMTGLGLGGVLPNVIALTAEISPRRRRAMLTSIVVIGMSLGSSMPSLVATQLVPTYGWQVLFVVGGVVPLVIAVILAFALPESLLFLVHRGAHRALLEKRVRQIDPQLAITPDTQFALRGAATQKSSGVRQLFQGDMAVTTPMLWLMFAGVLLSMHFVNSWISVLLEEAGLPAAQAAWINGLLHFGGSVAAVCTALLLGRLGLYWVLTLLVLGLCGLLTVATTGFGSIPVLTFAVGLAGFGIIGCQTALNASAGLIYPVSCRPTGVGAALGVGRIGSLSGPLVGGYFLATGLLTQHMFFVPMVPLGLACIATLVLVLRRVDIRNEGGGLAH